MPLIEGVGDEVTNFMVVMMVIIIGIFSWWSTSIAEQPLIRTVLILEPHNRHRAVGTVRTTAVSAVSEDTGQPESNAAETELRETASETVSENCVSNGTKLKNSDSQLPQEQDTEPSPGSSTQLAQASTSTSGPSHPTADFSSQPSSAAVTVKVSNSHDSGKNELRRRRLQFFQDKSEVPKVETGFGEASPDDDLEDKSTGTGSVENSSEASGAPDNSNQGSSGSREICKDNAPETGFHDAKCGSENSVEKSSDITPAIECSCSADVSQCSCSSSVAKEKSSDTIDSKAKAAPPDMNDIRIRLKYLNDNQKLVQGKLQEPLGDFKRRHFALEMEGNKVVRLIFNGQVLHSDDQTLQNYGLFDNCVVHCLVHTRRPTVGSADTGSNTNSSEDIVGGANVGATFRDWDLGQLLYIGLSGILTMGWILRFSNPHLFSVTSTIALVGLTGIYIITVVGMYIPDPDG